MNDVPSRFPELAYYAYLAREAGPAALAAAALRRARKFVARRLPGSPLGSERVFRLGAAGARAFPLDAGLAGGATFARRFPEAAARLVAQAADALAGRADCFGWTVDVDYAKDPLSGAAYDAASFEAIDLFAGGADPRGAWELGRLAHLLALAQAHAAGLAPGGAAAFCAGVLGFAAACPPGIGVQWAGTEEVAFRALNLALGYGLVRASPEVTPRFRAELCALLDAHGRHIEANLEDSGAVRTNHFAGDLLGLLAIGALFPELPRAARWAQVARDGLGDQLFAQVRGDGGDFEASTGYHRLASELFLAAWQLAALAGRPYGDDWTARLARMFRFARGTMKPDGRSPQLGDTDSCRVLWLAARDPLDHDYLPALGAGLLGDADAKVSGWPAPPELFWLGGERAVRRYEALPGLPLESEAFLESGVATLRAGDRSPAGQPAKPGRPPPPGFAPEVAHGRRSGDQLTLACTPNGQGGCGGHAHNDKLSVELTFGGRDVFADPGSCVYTADPALRDRFRSTASHSTVQVDGVEQSEILPGRLFALPDQARARLTWFEAGALRDAAAGEHVGYARLHPPVRHRREVSLARAPRGAVIRDALVGEGEHVLESRFALPHAAARVRAARPWEASRLSALALSHAGVRLDLGRCVEVGPSDAPDALVAFDAAAFEAGATLHLDDALYAPGYARRSPALTIRLRLATALPVALCACAIPILD